MNIFVLDLDHEANARYHCDQHVVKMILESAQILSTVAHKLGHETQYRQTHPNHPSVLWAGESLSNFHWLTGLVDALNDEFRYRYEKHINHRSWAVVQDLKPVIFKDAGLSEFPQVMPGEYQVPGNPVAAYRKFYIGEKLGFATWTRRQRPEWITDETQP